MTASIKKNIITLKMQFVKNNINKSHVGNHCVKEIKEEEQAKTLVYSINKIAPITFRQ